MIALAVRILFGSSRAQCFESLGKREDRKRQVITVHSQKLCQPLVLDCGLPPKTNECGFCGMTLGVKTLSSGVSLEYKQS